jgi:hypothetical protein
MKSWKIPATTNNYFNRHIDIGHIWVKVADVALPLRTPQTLAALSSAVDVLSIVSESIQSTKQMQTKIFQMSRRL